MSGQLTNQGARTFLAAFFGKRPGQIPEQFWIALIGDREPNISSTGSDIDEIDKEIYTSYERAQYQNVEENWQISDYDTIFNSQAIEFPVANETWGAVNYFGVCNEKTGGKLIAYGDLSSSQVVIEGDQVQIDIGGIAFTIFNPAYEGD
jgi:hypothetical protein